MPVVEERGGTSQVFVELAKAGHAGRSILYVRALEAASRCLVEVAEKLENISQVVVELARIAPVVELVKVLRWTSASSCREWRWSEGCWRPPLGA
jgi:hypothetical protein